MLKISQKQALERWDELPQNMRETIFSEVNADIVWRLGEENSLSEQKIRRLLTVVGDVFMGFLKNNIYEVAKEIQESVGLAEEQSLKVANEIDRKVFAPFKSDLNKIYKPLPFQKTLTPQSGPEIEPVPFGSQPITTGEIGVSEQSAKLATPSVLPEVADEIPTDAAPVIIHQEKPIFTPEAPREKPSVFFEPRRQKKSPLRERPVSAKIEEPEEKARVVHYSNLRTPLDTDAKKE